MSICNENSPIPVYPIYEMIVGDKCNQVTQVKISKYILPGLEHTLNCLSPSTYVLGIGYCQKQKRNLDFVPTTERRKADAQIGITGSCQINRIYRQVELHYDTNSTIEYSNAYEEIKKIESINYISYKTREPFIDCVRREVLEEAGLYIINKKYIKRMYSVTEKYLNEKTFETFLININHCTTVQNCHNLQNDDDKSLKVTAIIHGTFEELKNNIELSKQNNLNKENIQYFLLISVADALTAISIIQKTDMKHNYMWEFSK